MLVLLSDFSPRLVIGIRKNFTSLTTHDTPQMSNYRYSRLRNDFDDEDEDTHQQPPAEFRSLKDSYRLRFMISGGIITMFLIVLVVMYHENIKQLFCQMVCISQEMLGLLAKA